MDDYTDVVIRATQDAKAEQKNRDPVAGRVLSFILLINALIARGEII